METQRRVANLVEHQAETKHDKQTKCFHSQFGEVAYKPSSKGRAFSII